MGKDDKEYPVYNVDGTPSDKTVVPNSKNYFVLEAQTEDWMFLIQRLIVDKTPMDDKGEKMIDPTVAFARLDPNSPHLKYYLSREKFTAGEIAKLIGYRGDMSVFEDIEVIHLKPIGQQDDWEKPSVGYVGAA
jgi:hypothetical protein